MKLATQIIGLILSAGESRRMGYPKACLQYPDGTTLLTQQINFLKTAGCPDVVVVVGAHADEIRARHPELLIRWVINKKWSSGQFSSLQKGLKDILRNSPQGVILLPIDVVGVSPETLKSLIATGLSKPFSDAVIPKHNGKLGHPIFLSHRICSEIASIPLGAPNTRLDTILRTRKQITHIKVADPNVTSNINTIEDWEEYKTKNPAVKSRV